MDKESLTNENLQVEQEQLTGGKNKVKARKRPWTQRNWTVFFIATVGLLQLFVFQ